MKANYTLEKVETEDGFAATYLLMCDGYQVGSQPPARKPG